MSHRVQETLCWKQSQVSVAWDSVHCRTSGIPGPYPSHCNNEECPQISSTNSRSDGAPGRTLCKASCSETKLSTFPASSLSAKWEPTTGCPAWGLPRPELACPGIVPGNLGLPKIKCPPGLCICDSGAHALHWHHVPHRPWVMMYRLLCPSSLISGTQKTASASVFHVCFWFFVSYPLPYLGATPGPFHNLWSHLWLCILTSYLIL